MSTCDKAKHKSFQTNIGAGQNLKKLLGEENCPYVQSAEDLFHAFEPIINTKREMVIAGALDAYCRIVQWDIISVGHFDHSKFSSDLAIVGALNHGTSRMFLVQNRVSHTEAGSKSMFRLTQSVGETCALMGYEFVDHVVLHGSNYYSVFGSIVFASFVECMHVTSEPIQDAQFLWRWHCKKCGNANAVKIPSMNGHLERPIQIAQCTGCEGFQWLTTLKNASYNEFISAKHGSAAHAMS